MGGDSLFLAAAQGWHWMQPSTSSWRVSGTWRGGGDAGPRRGCRAHECINSTPAWNIFQRNASDARDAFAFYDGLAPPPPAHLPSSTHPPTFPSTPAFPGYRSRLLPAIRGKIVAHRSLLFFRHPVCASCGENGNYVRRVEMRRCEIARNMFADFRALCLTRGFCIYVHCFTCSVCWKFCLVGWGLAYNNLFYIAVLNHNSPLYVLSKYRIEF